MQSTRMICFLLSASPARLAIAGEHNGRVSARQDDPWQTTSNPTDPHEYVPPWYGTIRIAHAVLMSTVWLVLFPLGAMIIRGPPRPYLVLAHAMIQMAAFWMFIAAAGMGIWMANEIDSLSRYHPIIGIMLLALLAIQPATEIVNNIFYHRHPRVVVTAYIHVWLGRGLLVAGVIQGGLGFVFAASFPNAIIQAWPRVLYGVLALTAYIIYLAVGVIWPELRDRKKNEKKEKVELGVMPDGTRGGEEEMTVMAPVVEPNYYGYGYGGPMSRF